MTNDRRVRAVGDSLADGDSFSQSSDVAPAKPENRRRIRWWIPLMIIVLTTVANFSGRQWAGEKLSMRSLASVLPWMAAFVLTLFWWLFLSGARWGTRVKGLVTVVACLILFIVIFRWEGQAGNFAPHFGLRIFPTAEDQAVSYFESQADDSLLIARSQRLEITIDDWPRFGGANQDQIVRGMSIRRDWDANPPRNLWRHPIGPGWSSFSIVGDFAFTQEQRGDDEAVVCYDAGSGEQIWLHTDKVRFSDAASGSGPRATPTIHDSRLYALGATGVLNCLNPVTGERYWTTNIVADANTPLIEWGMAGSPLIYEDVVIVNPGGRTGAVTAYDQITGEKRWAGGGDRATYASPQVAELDGVPQILIYCASGLCGHDVMSGEKLWSFPWTNMTRLNIVQPIVLPDKSVFISSGYGGGSALLDVAQQKNEWKVESRWTKPDRFQLKFNGGIHRDGFVYGLDDGILSCFDLAIGEKTWKHGRYNFGQIVMVGDDLLVVAESGKVVLVEITPESSREIASFQAINGKTWNHPVLNRGRLYVRNGEEVACYDLSL